MNEANQRSSTSKLGGGHFDRRIDSQAIPSPAAPEDSSFHRARRGAENGLRQLAGSLRLIRYVDDPKSPKGA